MSLEDAQRKVDAKAAAPRVVAVRSQEANPPAPAARPALRVTPFRKMRKRIGATYHIKRVLPCNCFAVIYGASGSGKTFFVGYAALCIGSGREFLGHKVNVGLVVYLAPENPQSIEQRFAAWRDELCIDDASLVLISGDLDMLTTSTFAALMRQLRKIVEEHGSIAAVVVDTVSQAMPGADENSSDGMTAFVQACQMIRAEFACSVLAVHHSGKDDSRGARGHSSLHAAIDVEIKISNSDGYRQADITKVRDGESGELIGFHLRPIVIGQDEDGDNVTTCVVESDVTTAPSTRRASPTGINQKLVYQALQRCCSVEGKVPPGKHALSGIRAVALQTLREAVAAEEMNQIDAKHRSTRINDAISGLKAGNFVQWQDDWLWIRAPGVGTARPPSYRGGGAGGAGETPENTRNGAFGAVRGFGEDR